MNEQILIYLFCTDMMHQINSMLQNKRHALKSKGGVDILLSADIRKLQNDFTEVRRVANQQGEGLIQILSENYGCKFQFLVPSKEADKEGKEIKLTT